MKAKVYRSPFDSFRCSAPIPAAVFDRNLTFSVRKLPFIYCFPFENIIIDAHQLHRIFVAPHKEPDKSST